MAVILLDYYKIALLEPNQHIIIISEESCDADDWSKDFHTVFYCIFDPINVALVNIRDFFPKPQPFERSFHLW